MISSILLVCAVIVDFSAVQSGSHTCVAGIYKKMGRAEQPGKVLCVATPPVLEVTAGHCYCCELTRGVSKCLFARRGFPPVNAHFDTSQPYGCGG